jgi:AraC-like DNA-binding protein/Tfp pilus assembly protein PilF
MEVPGSSCRTENGLLALWAFPESDFEQMCRQLCFPFLLLLSCVNLAALPSTPSGTKTRELDRYLALTKKYTTLSADSCLKYGMLAIRLARESGDANSEAQANKRIGYALYLIGDYSSCRLYYTAAYRHFIGNRDYLHAAEMENLTGDAFNLQGAYPQAIHYLTLAERSCDSLIRNDSLKEKVKRLYAIIFTNIGLVYYNLDSAQRALECFRKALDYATEVHDSARMTASYNNLGMICRSEGAYSRATKYYTQAISIARKTGDVYYECKILNNLANSYEDLGRIDSAMFFIRLARKVSLLQDFKPDLILLDRNLARCFMRLHRYDSALIYLKNSLALSLDAGSRQKTYENYRLLSEVYEKMGNRELALTFFKRYSGLKDTVIGQETRTRISEIQTKYETRKKEQENVLLKTENQIKELRLGKKNTLLAVLSLVILVALSFLATVLILLRQKSRAYQNLVDQNLKMLEVEKQLENTLISALPDAAPGDKTPEDHLGELGVRFRRFLLEEKPYLWSDVNMDELCRKLNTNRTYLSRVINEQFQQTFYDLICEYRIRAARDMLNDKSYAHISVEGIGEMAGFKSNSNFHKKFKRLVGVTPSLFRERANQRG